jgi:hypothetical protein
VDRAAWHTALIAPAKVDGTDLSGLTMEQLEARRAQYERETASVPLLQGWMCGSPRCPAGCRRSVGSPAADRIAGTGYSGEAR